MDRDRDREKHHKKHCDTSSSSSCKPDCCGDIKRIAHEIQKLKYMTQDMSYNPNTQTTIFSHNEDVGGKVTVGSDSVVVLNGDIPDGTTGMTINPDGDIQGYSGGIPSDLNLNPDGGNVNIGSGTGDTIIIGDAEVMENLTVDGLLTAGGGGGGMGMNMNVKKHAKGKKGFQPNVSLDVVTNTIYNSLQVGSGIGTMGDNPQTIVLLGAQTPIVPTQQALAVYYDGTNDKGQIQSYNGLVKTDLHLNTLGGKVKIASVGNETEVGGDLRVKGALVVEGGKVIQDDLIVEGKTTLNELVTINAPVNIYDELTVLSNASVTGNLTTGSLSTGNLIVNDITIGGLLTVANLDVTGDFTASGTTTLENAIVNSLTVITEVATGDLTVGTTLSNAPFVVYGNSSFNGDVHISGNVSVSTLAIVDVNIAGTATISNLTVYNATTLANANIVNSLVVGSGITSNSLTTGNAIVGGSLNVTGASGVASITATNLGVSGNTTLTNLQVSGSASVTNNFTVGGQLTVGATITGANLNIGGGATIAGVTNVSTLSVGGASTFSGIMNVGATLNAQSLNVLGSANVVGTLTAQNLNISGATTFTGGLSVINSSTFANNLNVGQTLTAQNLNVTNNAIVTGGLLVNGQSTITNNLTIASGSTLSLTIGSPVSNSNLLVNGSATITGFLSVGSTLSVNAGIVSSNAVSAPTGNFYNLNVSTIANLNSLVVTNATTLSGGLSVVSNSTFAGNLAVTGSVSIPSVVVGGITTNNLTVSTIANVWNLNATGTTNLSTLTVSGTSTIAGTLFVQYATTIANNLYVTGSSSTLDGSLSIGGNLLNQNIGSVATIANLNVIYSTKIQSNLLVDHTSTFTGSLTMSNATLPITLTVGDLAQTNAFYLNGNATITGNLDVGSLSAGGISIDSLSLNDITVATLTNTGLLMVNGNSTMTGGLNVGTTLSIGTTITGGCWSDISLYVPTTADIWALNVHGFANFTDSVTIASSSATLTVQIGSTLCDSNMLVYGSATVSGSVSASVLAGTTGNYKTLNVATIANMYSASVSSTLTVGGILNVSTLANMYSASVASTLTVGANLGVVGNSTFTNNLNVGQTLTAQNANITANAGVAGNLLVGSTLSGNNVFISPANPDSVQYITTSSLGFRNMWLNNSINTNSFFLVGSCNDNSYNPTVEANDSAIVYTNATTSTLCGMSLCSWNSNADGIRLTPSATYLNSPCYFPTPTSTISSPWTNLALGRYGYIMQQVGSGLSLSFAGTGAMSNIILVWYTIGNLTCLMIEQSASFTTGPCSSMTITVTTPNATLCPIITQVGTISYAFGGTVYLCQVAIQTNGNVIIYANQIAPKPPYTSSGGGTGQFDVGGFFQTSTYWFPWS